MGRESGSSLMSELIHDISAEVPNDETRVALYRRMIRAFEKQDWDTQDDCQGEDPAFDRAMAEVHPDWNFDEFVHDCLECGRLFGEDDGQQDPESGEYFCDECCEKARKEAGEEPKS